MILLLLLLQRQSAPRSLGSKDHPLVRPLEDRLGLVANKGFRGQARAWPAHTTDVLPCRKGWSEGSGVWRGWDSGERIWCA